MTGGIFNKVEQSQAFTEHDVFVIISLGKLEIFFGNSKVLFLITFFHPKR